MLESNGTFVLSSTIKLVVLTLCLFGQSPFIPNSFGEGQRPHSNFYTPKWPSFSGFPDFCCEICICQDWDFDRLPESLQRWLGCKNTMWPINGSHYYFHFPESFPQPLLNLLLTSTSLLEPGTARISLKNKSFCAWVCSSHAQRHTYTHWFPWQFWKMEKDVDHPPICWKVDIWLPAFLFSFPPSDPGKRDQRGMRCFLTTVRLSWLS